MIIKSRKNVFGPRAHICDRVDDVAPDSVYIWLRVSWRSFFLTCFVFINRYPVRAVSTAALFLPVSSVLLPHRGWPTRKNERSRRNCRRLAPCKEKHTLKASFCVWEQKVASQFISHWISSSSLLAQTEWKRLFCCLMTPFLFLFLLRSGP